MAADVVMPGSGVSAGAVNNAGTTGGEPSAHMYALNTNHIFFRPHRDRNFVPIGGDRQSVNQDAIVKDRMGRKPHLLRGAQFKAFSLPH